MGIFEQSRHYFNYVLPDIILSNLNQINNFLSQFWWIFLILTLVLVMINMSSFTKNLKLKLELREFNDFYRDLCSKVDIKEIEMFLLKSMTLLRARFAAIYELRGETYVLIETNTVGKKNIATPLRIGKKDLKRFDKSGNFLVRYFLSNSKNYMLLLFTTYEIKKDRYDGYFGIMLGYYERILNSVKSKGSEALLNVSKDTSVSLMKLQMDKYQFFKFFIALIMKLTKASGARLLTKQGDMVFEYKPQGSVTMQKVFYIRNTPYKLEFFDDKPLQNETVAQIGSFLDMSGAFMENIDKKSEMVQNYLALLNFTNEAIELENKYYKNHSLIVQAVSVELAKSLFLTEEEIDTISLGASLHDIGMVGDLLAVLDKDEFGQKDMDLVKEHPLIGSIMVEPICHIYPISDIIKYHHERFDGKGYPFGLKESQIPIGAQVVSLGEFYAGITGDRSYKKGKSHEEAVEEIKKLRNKMFNTVIIDVFVEVEKSIKIKIAKIKSKKKDTNEQ